MDIPVLKCTDCSAEAVSFANIPRLNLEKEIEIVPICLLCAEKSSFFCVKHYKAHNVIFTDGSSICENCLNEVILEEEERSELYLIDIKKDVYNTEFEKLEVWLETERAFSKKSLRWCIAKALAMRALLSGFTIEHVIDRIAVSARVDDIIIEYKNLALAVQL